MTETRNSKRYDLESRTAAFAKNCRELVAKLKPTISNVEDGKQLVKASGSVGANYIEANEALGKKDFRMRIKICRKEAKESRYWLQLLNNEPNKHLEAEIEGLIKESTELMNIFGAILIKTS